MSRAYSHQSENKDQGDLPEIEWWSLGKIKETFGSNQHRAWLLEGFVAGCIELRQHGAGAIYLGGSFVDVAIDYPSDYDACFDTVGLSSRVDEALYNPDMIVERKERYRGDWLPARLDTGPSGRWLRFFAIDRNGRQRKLIALKLRLNELMSDD